MFCPNCGNPANEGDTFCGTCGTSLAVAGQVAAPAPDSANAQPTQVMPPVPPTQVMPPVQPTQVMPPVQQAPPAQPQQPASAKAGSKTGLIVALAVVGVIVVIGIAVGGFFAWRAFSGGKPEEIPVATTEPSTIESTESAPAAPSGFVSADEALADQLPDGWVSGVLTPGEDLIEYIIGPPNSEYDTVVVVAKQPDGTWLVESTRAFDAGALEGDVGALSPEEECRQLVGEFLYAVKEDRADDAHSLTIPPFSDDPASAAYSNGELTLIEVTKVKLQGDGKTVWVTSKEKWYGNFDSYIYICVPTENGYRISDLRIP